MRFYAFSNQALKSRADRAQTQCGIPAVTPVSLVRGIGNVEERPLQGDSAVPVSALGTVRAAQCETRSRRLLHFPPVFCLANLRQWTCRSPDPARFRLRTVYARSRCGRNRLKMYGKCSFGIPRPVSRMEQTHLPCRISARTRTLPPRSVYLVALSSRFQNTRLRPT